MSLKSGPCPQASVCLPDPSLTIRLSVSHLSVTVRRLSEFHALRPPRSPCLSVTVCPLSQRPRPLFPSPMCVRLNARPKPRPPCARSRGWAAAPARRRRRQRAPNSPGAHHAPVPHTTAQGLRLRQRPRCPLDALAHGACADTPVLGGRHSDHRANSAQGNSTAADRSKRRPR